jgi:hypothetical protein
MFPAAIARPGAAALHARDQEPAGSRVVLVAVTDAQNRPVVDLDTDDFQLEESGERREVFEARIADYPVVVLLDNGVDARGDVETIRSAAARFITRIGERSVAVVTMASPPEIIASFEDDRAAVLARLGTSSASTAPRAPLEALANAARLVRDAGAPFSAVIVVAAGPLETTASEAAGLLRAILESRAFVHGVGRRPSAAPTPGSLGGTPGVDSDLLRDLSSRTGGQFTTIFSPPSYAIALDRLADRLTAEFMVEYLVPPGTTSGSEVRVGVRLPGVRVRGMGVSR